MDSRQAGRRGGLRGGAARAKALSSERRVEIARGAAHSRWKPEVLVLSQPRDLEELECFVAFYGNGAAKHDVCNPGAALVWAVSASRDNACLARMLPVFIWRARGEVFSAPEIAEARGVDACALGYFLELTQRFTTSRGGVHGAARVLRVLRQKIRKSQKSKSSDPTVFFRSMDKPMLREHAARLTSPLAKSWSLVMGEPDESFESYFHRKIDQCLSG